jgi:hypothetical protein
LLSEIKNNNNSPLVSFAVTSALERLFEEEESPSLGSLKYRGDKKDARLHSKTTEEIYDEHIFFTSKLDMGDSVLEGGRVLKISSDAVGVFDHSLLLRQIGLFKEHDLENSNKVSPIVLRNLLEEFDFLGDRKTDGLWVKRNLLGLINFINERIIIPQYSLEESGDKWHELLPELTSDEWEEYLNTFEEGELYLHPVLLKNIEELYKNIVLLCNSLLKESTAKPVNLVKDVDITNNPEVNPFADKADEDAALLLRHLHNPVIRQSIEEKLHLSLVDMPLRSQVHLLRFLGTQNNEGFEKLSSVLNKNKEAKEDILYSFLACVQDTKMGEVIIKLAHELDPIITKELFKKYREIAQEIDDLDNFLAKEEFSNLASPQIKRNSSQLLIKEANNLLVEFSKQTKESSLEELLANLSRIKGSVQMSVGVIQTMAKEGKISLGEILGKFIQEKQGGSLNDKEKDEMSSIFSANRLESYTPELYKATTQDFTEGLNDPKKTFILLRVDHDILAFFHYESKEDGSIYLGSLNINPSAKNKPVVSGIAKQVVDELAKKSDLSALVYDKNPAQYFYRRSLGFKEVGEVLNYKGTGTRYLKLFRQKSE